MRSGDARQPSVPAGWPPTGMAEPGVEPFTGSRHQGGASFERGPSLDTAVTYTAPGWRCGLPAKRRGKSGTGQNESRRRRLGTSRPHHHRQPAATPARTRPLHRRQRRRMGRTRPAPMGRQHEPQQLPPSAHRPPKGRSRRRHRPRWRAGDRQRPVPAERLLLPADDVEGPYPNPPI